MSEKMFTSCLQAVAVLLLTSLPEAVRSDLHECHIPSNFTMMVGEGRVANITGSELWVGIKIADVTVTTNPETSSAAIVADNTIVAFRGSMFIQHMEDGASKLEKISLIHDGSARGGATLRELKSGNYTLHGCRLYLSSKENSRGTLPAAVGNKIRRLAELCMGPQVCQHIGASKTSSSSKEPGPYDLGPTSMYSRSDFAMTNTDLLNEMMPPSLGSGSPGNIGVRSDPLQDTINTLVDIALAELIDKLRKSNGGTIIIPDIHEVFTKGSGFFQLQGHFDATTGKFRDLTTLKRTEDAILSRAGLKFTASCGFGLSIAQLHYAHYRAKQAFFSVSGELTGNIDGVALGVSVSVDYNQMPCTKKLEYLKVTQLGKITIKVNGLGPFNSLISKLLSWVTRKWRDNIVSQVEDRLTSIAMQQLDKFNCEKFRP